MQAELTRGQVADRLGVSLATIRRMEGRHLHPITREDGVRLFDPAEVEAVVRSRTSQPVEAPKPSATAPPAAPARAAMLAVTGDQASDAFADFEAGLTPAAVVVSRHLSPDVVRQLHGEWLELRAMAVNVPDGAARLAALERTVEAMREELASIAEVVEATADRVEGLPLPSTHDFACQCGSAGLMSVAVTCTACGRETPHGTFPDRAPVPRVDDLFGGGAVGESQ